MSTPALSLRAICSEDEPFLRRVYASTCVEELALLGWSTTQQTAFLNQQFDAQHYRWSMDWVPRYEADHYIVPADG
jgi:hypothetical protein